LRVGSLTEHRQLIQLSLTLTDLLSRPFLKRPTQEAVARRLGEVFRNLLAEGTLGQAMQIPERLQELRGTEATAGAAELAFAELRKPESAAAFLERPEDLPPSAASTALRLAELLGYKVLDDLLEEMCEEEDLSRRRQIFDLMVSLGAPVVPRAQALLADERWYVQRNMIALLRRIEGALSTEMLDHGLEHEDWRVRMEALKGLGQGRAPAELIARAVNDPDPKVAQAAVAAIGNQRLTAGIAPLLALLAPRDPFGRNRALRLLALETLGQLGDPSALDGLAHFLRPWFSPVGSEERRAAYASLAGYPPESRQPWLKKGRWSSDLVVRRLCREMLRREGGAT
jgi:HEAT repeat protein